MENKEIVSEGQTICQRFLLEKKIGEGSFGQIFMVKDTVQNCDYALKLEKIRVGKKSCLEQEAAVMSKCQKLEGFPKLVFIGKEKEYRILVMSLLGRNMQMLFKACENKFSKATLFKYAVEAVSRLESIHEIGLLHRDMKPENFVEGMDGQRIYLIDFGLAKTYLYKGHHIKKGSGYGLIGTVRYCSINCHKGNDQSRRDDLQSLGYVLVYLCKGALPWMNLPAKNKKEKQNKIFDMKIKTSLAALTADCPHELFLFLKNVMSLKFKDKPNYSYLKELFLPHIPLDNFVFDWKKKEIEYQKVQQTLEYHTKSPKNSSIQFEDETEKGEKDLRVFKIAKNPFMRQHPSYVESSDYLDLRSHLNCTELSSQEYVINRYQPQTIQFKGIH